MKYRTVIIGAGKMGAFYDSPKQSSILSHAHAICENNNFELIGFYDKDYEKCNKAAEIWHTEAFSDLNKCLSCAEIVCCSVPDIYHYDILNQCASFNPKLVFTEKPLVQTLDQATNIRTLYTESHIPLLLNYSRRFLAEFRKLKNEIKSFGKLMKGSGYYGKGILHNGSHMIDLLFFLFDTCEYCSTERKVCDYSMEDQTFDCTLKMEDAILNLQGIDSRKVTIFELDLLFEKKRIQIIDGGLIIKYYDVIESELYNGYYTYQDEKVIDVEYSNSLVNAVDHIDKFLAGSEDLICSIYDGIRVLDMCTKIVNNDNGGCI